MTVMSEDNIKAKYKLCIEKEIFQEQSYLEAHDMTVKLICELMV